MKKAHSWGFRRGLPLASGMARKGTHCFHTNVLPTLLIPEHHPPRQMLCIFKIFIVFLIATLKVSLIFSNTAEIPYPTNFVLFYLNSWCANIFGHAGFQQSIADLPEGYTLRENFLSQHLTIVNNPRVRGGISYPTPTFVLGFDLAWTCSSPEFRILNGSILFWPRPKLPLKRFSVSWPGCPKNGLRSMSIY